ncbi:MAG TPA: hypothetical protein VM347_22990 [Nonomuraea sp.]|nr:hypothetical protein [Nonomuraea sp.]
MSELSRSVLPTGAQRRMPRPVLWLLLVISAVLNIVTSNIGINIFIGIGFGLATLACAAALVVDHYRHRRP